MNNAYACCRAGGTMRASLLHVPGTVRPRAIVFCLSDDGGIGEFIVQIELPDACYLVS